MSSLKTMNFQLRKFNLNKIKDDATIALIGGRRTGKTTIIKDVLYHKRHMSGAIVMSGTDECTDAYTGIVPDSFIFDGWRPDIAAKLLKRQKRLKRSGKSDKSIGIILLMEDLGFDSKIWAKSREIKNIFMNGRHNKIMCILPMQYVVGIGPDLRQQIDYIFILRENKHNLREKIWEHWAGIFPNAEIFGKVLSQCSNNYECLVIDNTSNENQDIEDNVFWFKADVHTKKFRIGSDKYWNSHLKKYNPRYMDDESDHETMTTLRKKKVIVNKMY